MIYRPFHMLGRKINHFMHELGSRDVWHALKIAGLFLLAIWAVFLPVLALVWYVVLQQAAFPYDILLRAAADSVLFVVACFLGVRFRLAISRTMLRAAVVVLVVLLFMPILTVIWTRTLPLESVNTLTLSLYYGWTFEAWTFSVLGLLAGLHGYHDVEPGSGGRMRWSGTLRPADLEHLEPVGTATEPAGISGEPAGISGEAGAGAGAAEPEAAPPPQP